jgi:hypothetical protein
MLQNYNNLPDLAIAGSAIHHSLTPEQSRFWYDAPFVVACTCFFIITILL